MDTKLSVQPTTLPGIKRAAKTIKRERGISHAEALDAAAQAAGYQNFRHARNSMASVRAAAPQLAQPATTAAPSLATSQPEVPPTSRSSLPAQTILRRPFTASAYADNLRLQIRSNDNTLQALLDGRVTGMGYVASASNARSLAEASPSVFDGGLTGMGYGTSIHSAVSLAREIERLEQRIVQDRALLRMHEAKEQLDQAHAEVRKDWQPQGNGTPSLQAIAWLEETEREFRAAQAELQRHARQRRATFP